MKPMNLNSLISNRIGKNLERVALIGTHGHLRFSDLLNTFGVMRGKRVAFFIADTLNLIRALVALDGSAKAVCPISTSIGEKELYHLVSENEFDVVVSDLSERDLEIFTHFKVPAFKVSDICLEQQKEIDSRDQSTSWLVPTSGTSSSPKLVSHTLASLGAVSLRHRKAEAKSEVWGLFYDVTRYAGYQTLLNCLFNGHTLVTSSVTDSLNERVERCAAERVTHISATPSQWRKILMTGEVAKRIPLEQIVLGGEASDQQILNALRSVYPDAKITHTYASTEAGLGFSVSDGLAGFPLRYFDGAGGISEIKVSDDKLFLRTSSSATNYVNGEQFKDSQGWVNTGDLVKVEVDRFFVIGRESGIINVGGDKVNPENVRLTLLEHQDIIQANVFGKKNPITGMVLAANIQLKDNVNVELAKASIKVFLKEKLPMNQRPRIVRFVDEIELSITGKLGRGK